MNITNTLNFGFRFLNNDYIPTGQIENYPLEIVDKMIVRQVEQGNTPDVKVFERDYIADKHQGGFSWEETAEGLSFWLEVIEDENFDLFFERYPKNII